MYFFFGFFIARKLIHLVLKEGIGCRIIIFHRELPSTNQTMYGKKYNRCAILQCKAACSRVLRIHGGCERFDIKNPGLQPDTGSSGRLSGNSNNNRGALFSLLRMRGAFLSCPHRNTRDTTIANRSVLRTVRTSIPMLNFGHADNLTGVRAVVHRLLEQQSCRLRHIRPREIDTVANIHFLLKRMIIGKRNNRIRILGPDPLNQPGILVVMNQQDAFFRLRRVRRLFSNSGSLRLISCTSGLSFRKRRISPN